MLLVRARELLKISRRFPGTKKLLRGDFFSVSHGETDGESRKETEKCIHARGYDTLQVVLSNSASATF